MRLFILISSVLCFSGVIAQSARASASDQDVTNWLQSIVGKTFNLSSDPNCQLSVYNNGNGYSLNNSVTVHELGTDDCDISDLTMTCGRSTWDPFPGQNRRTEKVTLTKDQNGNLIGVFWKINPGSEGSCGQN